MLDSVGSRPLEANSARQEITSLTGLRGIAALTVVIGHVLSPCFFYAGWVSFQNAAVDIFFCLSGFTLSLAYSPQCGKSIHWTSYAVARFARIYPLYFVVLLISAWYSYCWNVNAFTEYTYHTLARDSIAQLFMVNAWPAIGTGAHWAAPMWSLSIEVFCYLAIFPVLALASRRALKLDSQIICCIIVLLGMISYIITIKYLDSNVNQHNPARIVVQWQAHWVPVIRGVTMFTAGWLAYILWAKQDEFAKALQVFVTVLAVAVVATLVGSDFGVLDRQIMIVITPFLLVGLMSSRSLAARALSCRPIHLLGLMSYSIYAIHWPVFFFSMVLFQGRSNQTIALGCIIGTTALAPISYYALEIPARSGIKKLFKSKWRSLTPVSQAA